MLFIHFLYKFLLDNQNSILKTFEMKYISFSKISSFVSNYLITLILEEEKIISKNFFSTLRKRRRDSFIKMGAPRHAILNIIKQTFSSVASLLNVIQDFFTLTSAWMKK